MYLLSIKLVSPGTDSTLRIYCIYLQCPNPSSWPGVGCGAFCCILTWNLFQVTECSKKMDSDSVFQKVVSNLNICMKFCLYWSGLSYSLHWCFIGTTLNTVLRCRLDLSLVRTELWSVMIQRLHWTTIWVEVRIKWGV